MLDNPLQMNDWKIKNFLLVAVVLQATVLVLGILSIVGVNIAAISYPVGFIYLTFIPGIVILRIFKMHELGTVKTLLFSVGLSLSFNMLLGFIVDILLPYAWISRPISTLPLIISWMLVLGVLCYICYRRDKDYSAPVQINVSSLVRPPVLFFLLLPLLAVVGTQLVNGYSNNVVLITAIILIALVPLVVSFGKALGDQLFPLAIYSISLTLLWHQSLFSDYLTGYDIFTEFYYFNLVINSGFWDWTISHSYNAMMSVTILPAIYSQVLHISGTQIFKFFYPVFYSLVPVGLYEIYRRYFNTRTAFFAAFIFVSMFVFYSTMPSVARQMIGEFFFVLLILLITERQATASQKALFIIFGRDWLYLITRLATCLLSTFLSH